MIDGLLNEVKKEQDALLGNAAARDEVRRRLMTQAITPRRAPFSWAGWAAAAVVLLAAGATMTWFASSRAPFTYVATTDGMKSEDGFVSSRGSAHIAFSDGSGVSLGAESAARIVDLTHRGAGVALVRGRLHASIRHRDDTSWRVFAGPYSVAVTGTKFDVQWSDSDAELNVSVEEGSVRVSGSCMTSAVNLRAGEHASLRCSTLAMAPPHVVPPAQDVTPPSAATATALPPRANVNPTSSAGAATSSFSARIDDAQRAAIAGDTDEARAILLDVRERAQRTNDGALAAFLLGRLAFDSQHDFAEAARWFADYETSAPDGALIREAMGRHLEAVVHVGDTARARELAAGYLARFPDGPHAALARQQTP